MKVLARIAAAWTVVAVPLSPVVAVEVNFITDFGYNGRHSYFYVALDKGYYRAEGLEVSILRGQGSADAIKKVASGAAAVGFADAGALALARSNDAIPVKLLSIVYAGPPHAIFAVADGRIKTAKDLEGKTVADSAFSAIPLIFNAFAQSSGIDREKVKWISAESAALPSLLATGRVDAVGQFTVGEPLLAATVAPRTLVRIAYKDAGLDYYGNGLIATERTIAENPTMLKAFVRATQKGMRDAFANPKEAGAILNKYQKQISPEVAEGETKLVSELATPPGHKLGVIDPTRIQRTIDIMTKSFPMKTPVQAADMFVPGYVE